MPRIPTFEGGSGESTSTGNVSPSAVNAVFRQTASDIDRIAFVQQKVAAEEQRQRDSLALSRATLDAERGLSFLRDQALQSDDFLSAPDNFRAGAASVLESASGPITNPEDRAAFAIQSGRHADALLLSVSNDTRRRVADEQVATLDVMGQSAERSYASFSPDSPTDALVRSEIRDGYIRQIELAGKSDYIGDAPVRIQRFLAGLDENDAIAGISENPVRALSDLSVGSGKYENMTESKRLELASRADRAIAAEGADHLTEGRLARAAYRDASQAKRKDALLAIDSPDRTYGFADLERDAPDLTASDLSVVRAAMGQETVSDGSAYRMVRKAATAPDASFDDIESMIGGLVEQKRLNPQERDSAYALNLRVNSEDLASEEKEAHRLVDTALNPSAFETFAGKAPAALRADSVMNSIDAFIADLPKDMSRADRNRAIRIESRELVSRASSSEVAADQLKLIAPYGSASKESFTSGDDRMERLLGSMEQLDADLRSGRIGASRYQAELDNLSEWKIVLETEARYAKPETGKR